MEPPRRLRFALKRYGLDRLRVLDLGCGPGEYLRHFGPDSLGLDLNPAQADGLNVQRWNFREGIPGWVRGFDAVWCSNLLEHVLAPHEFLIDLRGALREGGRLFVSVPQATRLTRGPWRGQLAVDHINFFTPRTLALTLERAGYRIAFLGNPSLPLHRLRIGPTLMTVCQPVPDFQYNAKAHKRLVEGSIEFVGP